MRWQSAWTCTLALVTLTGCPEEFGKEGRIQRAIHQDMMELHQKYCSDEDIRAFCEGGKEQSEECRRCIGR